jgi:hypothetical protein
MSSKHDYPELAGRVLDTLGDGDYKKEEILKAVDLPLNQFTWRGIRTAFAQGGILCHYSGGGYWALRWGQPRESAGAIEMWSVQVAQWCKNMRTEFVGLIQATSDDAEAYLLRLVEKGIDPLSLYIISEALNGELPSLVENTMRDAYVSVIPVMPPLMRERIQARLGRIEAFAGKLLSPPPEVKDLTPPEIGIDSEA